jgi:DNA primase
MTVVDDIKSRIDLVDEVSQTVKLRRTGKNYTGFCPFHSNTRTEAFVVFPETQTWRCFGQCNTGGDVFGFVMKRESWDFSEALHYLAEKAGVTLTPLRPEAESETEARQTLSIVLEEAAQFFQQQLLDTTPGHNALDYLHGRGLTDETIHTWGLGYAPAGWNALGQYLRRAGYTDSLMLDAGLLTEREDGGTHDKFRNRLMFPIRDASGHLTGFGGRVLDPEDIPKYLNSPRTDLFDKGRLLFGLDRARQTIREKEQAVIVEGYMDVIGLHQAGFKNAVSPMGTALTEDQFKLLKRYTRNLILALDPDAAGEKATLRGLELARSTMDQEGEISFDSRGLLHVESRLSADIRVTTLPDGRDPDEIALQDPAQWAEIIAQARPVVVHVMETLAAGQDLEDAKVKRAIAEQVLPLIEDVTNPVEREAYRQRLARLIRVDERALAPSTPAIGSGKRRRKQAEEPPIPVESLRTAAQRNQLLERHALRFLTANPEMLYQINKSLGLLELGPLTEDDFLEGEYKYCFGIIQKALAQEDYSPREYLQMNLPDIFAEESEPTLIERTPDPGMEKTFRDQVRNILRIRRNLCEERISNYIFVQSEDGPKTYSEEEFEFLLLEQSNLRGKIDQAFRVILSGADPSKGKVKRI